ncbi:MAG: sterol desaturase family protein [Algisphaera sp.]
MISIIWDTRGYFFWLLMASLLCFALERFWPWRKTQPALRPQLGQDLIWLILNGHYVGIAISAVTVYLGAKLAPGFFEHMESYHLLSTWPLAAQILVFFILKDFFEWCVHNLLHRNRYLWELHKLHHSIVDMDWIGSFRFHWGEVVVYHTLTYLPLVIMGVDGRVILWIAIFATLIGHLNHSNLNITWGPLRYIFNSPRMHIWHHEHELTPAHPSGVNFGISLSLWDWLLGTAHWPDLQHAPTQQPEKLGFHGLNHYPKSFVARLFYPLTRRSRNSKPD